MAKNDYHVLACRVLAYLYACLKAGSEVSAEYLTDIFCKAGAGEAYQDYVLRQLFQSGYLEGVQTVDLPGKAFPGVKPARGLMITPEGIEYLQNNSAIGRARAFLKSLRESVPGI